jgi:PKD repeat protein
MKHVLPKSKVYLFIFIGLLIGLSAAKAQDSTSCTANFTSSVSGYQAVFYAADSQSNILHDWIFGDGTSSGFGSRYSIISHVYGSAGTYRVTHIIKDSLGGGCFDSSSQNITITLPPACQIAFTSVMDSTNDHVYSFYSTSSSSTGAIDSVFWYVNDTLVATGTNLLSHYFPFGTSSICAKLSTSTGCTAQQCAQIYVPNQDSSCLPPISFSYTAGSNPQKITFTPSLNDSTGYKYHWSFGDGSSSTARTPSHLYASGGNYPVTLQITAKPVKDSCVATFTETIYVAEKDTCKVTLTYKANPKKSNEITFTAQSSLDLDSVTWVLQSPSDSTVIAVLEGQKVTYTFTSTGCYPVNMTATAASGCTASSAVSVCIDSIPAAASGFVASYPNPATSQAYLDLVLPSDNSIRIGVFNTMGNNVQTLVIAGTKGQNRITIPIGALPTGIYYVQIQYGNEVLQSKIQKL